MESTVDDLLKAVKRLSPDQLSQFHVQFAEWQEFDPLAGKPESFLVQQTKLRLPCAVSERLKELAAKSEQEALSPDELDEYRQLAQRDERLNATRVLSLAELARRRNQPVSEIMQQIGWHEGPDAA